MNLPPPLPVTAEAWNELSMPERQHEATRLLAELRATPEPPADTLGALDGFVSAYASKFSSSGQPSPHTIKAYRTGAREVALWSVSPDGTDLGVLTMDDAMNYRHWLEQRPSRRGRPLSRASCELRLVAARVLLAALEWAGVRNGQPFAKVKMAPDRTAAIVKYPPYKDLTLSAVSVLAAREDDEGRRLWALYLLCLHAGLRASEALELRRWNVKSGVARVVGKGGKTRKVPLSTQLISALDALVPIAPRVQGRYFSWTYGAAHAKMQKVFEQAGEGHEWRGFHALRKACATRLYHQTLDFTRVSLFLGHASADTTRRYVAVEGSDVALQVIDWKN